LTGRHFLTVLNAYRIGGQQYVLGSVLGYLQGHLDTRTVRLPIVNA
jgi:hypothetical protein